MELANRIRKIREAYNLTQAEVAHRTGITPQAYGKIERRASKTKFETLLRISNSIGVTIDFLVDLKNPCYVQKNNS